MEDSLYIVLYFAHIPPAMGIIQSHHNSVDFAGEYLLPRVVGKISLVGIAVGNIFRHSITVCIRAFFCKKADTGNSGPAYIICVIASPSNGCGFPGALIHEPDSIHGLIVSCRKRGAWQQGQHHAQCQQH